MEDLYLLVIRVSEWVFFYQLEIHVCIKVDMCFACIIPDVKGFRGARSWLSTMSQLKINTSCRNIKLTSGYLVLFCAVNAVCPVRKQ